MLQYEIAGLKLGILHGSSKKFKRLIPFESSFTKEPDIEISFQSSGCFAAPKYVALKNDSISFHTEYTNGKTIVYVYIKRTDRTEYVIEADRDWSAVTVTFHEGDRWIEREFCDILGNFIISNAIISRDGLVMHASSISYNGRGIAFTAPSGTGKSTHAAMWRKYYNAVVLNDDCPIIRYENGKPNIYGTPWSGSQKTAVNQGSPLSAIVVLEQSPVNLIRELTNAEATPMLLPRIFLPYHNPVFMDKALQNADNIFGSVPKYLLRCRPDREAMELVHQCIG